MTPLTLPRFLVALACAIWAFIWIKYLRSEDCRFDPEDVIILLLLALCIKLLA